MKLSIIIPTKDRPYKILKILKILKLNKFFFNEIIIVDSSSNQNKEILKKILLNFNLKLRLFHSRPSISKQRNIGIRKIKKNNKYLMFLDDDITFKKNSFREMYNYLENNLNYNGYMFNLISKSKKNFFEKLKKSNISRIIGLYENNVGKVLPSGWHTKIENVKRDTETEWLPSCATIYKNDREILFDEFFADYSYLEDLEYSFRQKKYGKLIVVKKAQCFHKNFIERKNYLFGKKEIINRFYFVKKHNLSLMRLFLGIFIKIIMNLFFLQFYKVFGNIIGLLTIIKNYFF